MSDDLRCRPHEELRKFLDRAVSAGEEDGLVGHLDGCESCRRRLEALAAEPADWDGIRGLLPENALNAVCNEAMPRLRSGRHGAEIRVDFLSPTDDPAMLGRLGTYEVIGVIGAGGMGLVLKAFDRALNRNVAIKVLAPQLAASPLARRRFAREARAAAAVAHEHVIAVHAVSEFQGLPYLVMPYFPAQSLQHRLDTGVSLSVPEILRISRQIAAGLAAAHQQGLVHRDIKPANILVEEGIERVVITDFGLARAADDAALTRTGVITGTPQYMAPEQTREESLDHRADLFSLGSVMYALCTGRPPYRAETALAVLRRISEESPRPIQDFAPEIPEWLVEIVAKLHEKNPAHRYQTAAEVSALLQNWLAHVQNPMHVPPPVRPGNLHRGKRMYRMLVTLAGCFLVGLVGVATYPRFAALTTPAPAPLDNVTPPNTPATQEVSATPVTHSAREASAPPLGEQWSTIHEVKSLASEIDCVSIREDGTRHPSELIPHPLMRIDDPARGRTGTSRHDGALWAWGESGRPIALAEIWRWNGDSNIWGHAMISTTPGRVVAEIGGQIWHPDKPGLEFQKLSEAPGPSAFRENRAAQMKELAKGFSGFEVHREQRIDLETIDDPVYRYESTSLDGGIFVLSHHHNPEAIVFIEAASEPTSDAVEGSGRLAYWRYAIAPASSQELHITYQRREVAAIPEAERLHGNPSDPFWVLYARPSFLNPFSSGTKNDLFHSTNR